MRRYEWGDAYLLIYVALDAPVTYAAGPDALHGAYVQRIGAFARVPGPHLY